MTFAEYKDACDYKSYPEEWRAGQAAFNLLQSRRSDLADQVRGTELDPFYRDERLPKFYEWVEAHWE